MFEYLRDYKNILVTGPQRSGTTICSRMIAYSLKRRCVDEQRVPIRSRISDVKEYKKVLINNLCGWFNRPFAKVVQCPTAASFCHELSEDLAVVFMVRNVDEILRSQKRIRWRDTEERRFYPQTKLPIAVVKYNYWNEVQKDMIENAFEIQYGSLKEHPLWIPKRKRRNFHSKQTELNRAIIKFL